MEESKQRKEELIAEIMGYIKVSTYVQEKADDDGVTLVGDIPPGVKVYSPVLDMEISINTFSEQHENIRVATSLIKLAAEEAVNRGDWEPTIKQYER